jgi:NAD-dependent SIR2 family protein deacetylase
MNNYYGMKCPHCGCQTTVDPALLEDDAPMPYCPECDEPLFGDKD